MGEEAAQPRFANTMVCAINRDAAKMIRSTRGMERCWEVIVRPKGLREVRRFVCMHGLHTKAEDDEGLMDGALPSPCLT